MNLPEPLLQVEFATMLEGSRHAVMASALRETVGSLDIRELDVELSNFVPGPILADLARNGLRGEALFPVPLVLSARPTLLGYYRLLYGYSQKQFYSGKTGGSAFALMESKGVVSRTAAPRLGDLCAEFARNGVMLLQGLGPRASASLFSELTLLTLGAQFRGGMNNRKGSAGIEAAFAVMRQIVADSIVVAGERRLDLRNAAGRIVRIEIAADPDILITSEPGGGDPRPIVAIEVKAGEDHSNIWNRLGEAEKSHPMAKAKGVTDCWTIINDAAANDAKLRQASPTSNRFYQLLELTNEASDARREFGARVRDMIGLPVKPQPETP